MSLGGEFAGSDGDMVTAAIRILGLGPVVGTRTWGGVVGIRGSLPLIDGGTLQKPRELEHQRTRPTQGRSGGAARPDQDGPGRSGKAGALG